MSGTIDADSECNEFAETSSESTVRLKGLVPIILIAVAALTGDLKQAIEKSRLYRLSFVGLLCENV